MADVTKMANGSDRNAMKHIAIVMIVCGFAAACSVRSEKVVERPAPPPASATVVTTSPPPPPSSTVVVPSR